MIKRLKPKSEFSRNVLTLMTGTTIAQAIPIAITPILTRLYTPEDFGVLALFLAITAILGSIANARYELAIMLPEEDEDAINIAALGILIAVCFSLVLLITAIAFNDQIVSLIGNEEIGFWLYFVPFVVLIIALYNVLNYLNTRKTLYKDIAKSKVYKATAMSVVQLLVGFLKSGSFGLVIGSIASHIFSNLKLMHNFFKYYDLKKRPIKWKIFKVASRYSKFPRYMMPATLFNTMASKLVEVGLPILYNLKTLGFYFLVQRVLATPASLIGESIAQVFFQNLSVLVKDRGKFRNKFWKVVFALTLISAVIFSTLYLIIVDFFILVFGDEWRVAGDMARILLPLFAIQFIVSPLTSVNQVLENTGLILAWQIMLFISYLTILLNAYVGEVSFMALLENIALIISLNYLFYLLVIGAVVERGKH